MKKITALEDNGKKNGGNPSVDDGTTGMDDG